MSWQLETTSRFDKEFKKLDRYTQKLIHGWITKNIDNTDDPRQHGEIQDAAASLAVQDARRRLSRAGS